MDATEKEIEYLFHTLSTRDAAPFNPSFRDTGLARMLWRDYRANSLREFLAHESRVEWLSSFKDKPAQLVFLLRANWR
jgi:hypothetical protein